MTQTSYDSLIFTDPHFASAPIDEYRFQLFPQIADLITKHNIKRWFMLGDLTNAKDNHPARLVNKIVSGLSGLARRAQGIILPGNHDGVGDIRYFEFMREIPGIAYIDSPVLWQADELQGCFIDWLFLPHSRDPLVDWNVDVSNKLVFTHITVNDVSSEMGHKLKSSIGADFFAKSRLTFSGDIHMPQQLDKVVYVGSPYNTRFGDQFEGGIVLFNSYEPEKFERVLLDFPRRYVVDVQSVQELEQKLSELRPNSQLKVRLHFTLDNMNDWRKIQNDVIKYVREATNFQLCGVEPKRDFDKVLPQASAGKRQFLDFEVFCKNHQIPDDLKEFMSDIIKKVS